MRDAGYLTIHFPLFCTKRDLNQSRGGGSNLHVKPLHPATLCICALHKEASSGSRKGAESTCRGCIVHVPPLTELYRLHIAGWVFIPCHHCSATGTLGAAWLLQTPLLPGAHRNCPLAGLPEELLRNQLLLSRFAAPGGFLPLMH